MKCILCHSDTDHFYYSEDYDRNYRQCRNCSTILLHKDDYISPEKEKARYATHNNDIHDPGYRKFVQPVADKITQLFNKDSTGLDYGSGPGPVITYMLREKGYQVNTFDPFFDVNPQVLQTTYDYIFCCEVIEHFHQPDREFKKLKALLRPGGILICKTDPYTEQTNFAEWYYKNDETHTIFYHPESFEWIRKNIGFSSLEIEKRLISFIS